MPDIDMRFDLDMLVLSAPIETALAHQGIDVEADREFLSLIEPDSIKAVFRMEAVAGAQCIVTNTAGITQARLTHQGMEDRASEFASAALAIVSSLAPQHILAEIGPTQLPIDPADKTSMKQNRNQYAQAAKAFGDSGYDALFLNNMVSIADLKCALTGVRMVYDGPVFTSVQVDAAGLLVGRNDRIEDACFVMAEYGADVAGFSTYAPLGSACAMAHVARTSVDVPLLVQLAVNKVDPQQLRITDENPYYCADTMIEAAALLRGEGVQFLRAAGAATPAYTGALVAATAGFDVADTENNE